MAFRVRKFFERVGPGFAFYYKPGQVIDATAMDHERLVRDGFIEVFGEEAAERKAQIAAEEQKPEAEPKRRGRPRKVVTV